ncbi:translation factor (SUA5) [Pseudoclavibacter chungangensis]|uniref:Translation factor (SUA5) n=1 Tax=Pseudoclavibacter chungangensis TaxID=587635 RepID=A0A7J5BWL6_9MICO|nr:Sua5/YciO/YrdC/YwlC family protein [Pseudoclavibacter chungangensis]KAB1657951.1 translation factor (SUA5) [Pseudoclavibacter chungangensis]NYJ65895.1 tRNA A37 threonylcarbamoyladenosine synthetase subunit TsaC/SUA5/YrdC [Pseudoclavibacter chungangensis]
MSTHLTWNGGVQQEAVDLLHAGGGMVVSPTKVGYIVVVTDRAGLERKFEAKQRKRNKPAVVLCGSLEELHALARTNDEIDEFYRRHWDDDILLGCILPWSDEGRALLGDDEAELATDVRGTSCFVVRFGAPGEAIAKALWDEDRTILFASSANPSGRGNRGLVSGIGEAIDDAADLVIEADDFVRSVQPDASPETRYEQGVMVSFVDEAGELVPEQHGERQVSPAPIVIRGGLDIDRIMSQLARSFPSWDYRHGQYY